jgi:hypothetical protein
MTQEETNNIPTSIDFDLGDFRNRLRQQIADTILLEPNGSEGMKLLDICGDVISQSPHSNKDKGELFTVFRQANFQKRFPRKINTIPSQKGSTRFQDISVFADDRIEIISQIGENSPPPGKYLVKDKFGSGAFAAEDEGQAEKYSDFLKSTNGNITTQDGQQYGAIIYFCDTIEGAVKVLKLIKYKNLNQNIYIGYYNINAKLEWLKR